MVKIDEKVLAQAALDTLSRSYAPYSHFHVAAALLCEDGTVITGVNVENAAYSATVCAERSAVFQAVSRGYRRFLAVAICGGKDGVVTDYCPPCGVCRQVLREFSIPEEFKVILAKTGEDYRVYGLDELLPLSFGPDFLGK